MIEPVSAADARKARWWLILAIVACAALYLVGNGRVPLWDRDEGWYAQCSKQMWETGDWVVPKYLDKLRTEKPVFVYWLQLGGYWLFGGVSEFAVRFYAAVAQTIVLGLIGVGFSRLAGPRRGAWAAFIYGTSVMAIISAKMCLTDATLMVFLMIAQLCLMAFYLGYFSWSGVVLLFVALGFGALTKGPVAFVPTAFTIIFLALMDYKRWVPLVKPGERAFWDRISHGALVVIGGLVIMLAVCAPWLIVLHLREPRWLPAIIGVGFEHLTQPVDGHKGPFGYYLLFIWGTYFPWSLLLPTAAYVAWKQRNDPVTRFAIAATLGPWLFFEVMKTKLPHYPLATYPFISLLVADAIVRCARGQYLEFFKRRFVIAVGVWAVVVGALASAPWIATFAPKKLPGIAYLPMTVVSVMGFVCTIGTFWLFYRRKPLYACGWMGGSFIALIALAYGWLIPQTTYLQTCSRVADVLAKYDGTGSNVAPGEVAAIIYTDKGKSYGFEEPSLYFYQGGTMRSIETPNYLETTPPEKWPRLMVVADEAWDRFPQRTRDQLKILDTVRGYLYSDKHAITDVYVVRRKTEPEMLAPAAN